MSPHRSIYIFGDQTSNLGSRFEALVHQSPLPTVATFLDQAYLRLSNEISSLSNSEREEYPRSTCFADILSWDREQLARLPALQGALTFICQSAEFIRDIETTGRPYPDTSNAVTCGLCIGALCAAAVRGCSSLVDFLHIAVPCVRIAFRTGLLTTSYGQTISTHQGPWSIAVSTTAANASSRTIEHRLQAFNDNANLPKTHRAYISADISDFTTISGPPETLDFLRESSAFSDLKTSVVPIHAPYHAPHLFTPRDVSTLIQGSLAPTQLDGPCPVRMVSSTTGILNAGGTLEASLESALIQILLEPLSLLELSKTLSELAGSSDSPRLEIISVGTHITSVLASLLKRSDPALQVDVRPCLTRDASQAQTLPPSIQRQSSRSKIAIIGMSGRYPGAENNAQFWELLRQGLDVHSEAPASRWNVKTHVDPTGARKNTSSTGFGCWLDHAEAFDAQFFNISPREAPQIDPAQRIALMTAYEAIEQAGVVPNATPSTRKDRVGVFYGVTSNDWMETNSAQNIDTYFIPGGNRAFIPGRVNYFFKFSGPSYSIDTACSSSLAAIHLACNSLWMGDADMAIAGGTNVLTNPDFTAGLDRGHFLSRTGNCKTFDNGADGYCRGEGVGTVILKRLEDAIADNDPIQAVILGAYTNHSAEAESITRPHVGAQKAIFSKILRESGVDPKTVSYVEMHGTGTQAGDLGEMNSVLDTFAPSVNFRGEHKLFIGSVKSNVGHGEAASGVTALAKVLLMLRNNSIPPHCGIKTKINEKFPTDLTERSVHIAARPTPWVQSGDAPRRVFINNFSAAGGNSALLLEDGTSNPSDIIASPDTRSTHVVAITAKHASSLAGNVRSLLQYLQESDNNVDLGKLSYTTTARRIHHQHRVVVTGSSSVEIRHKLQKVLSSEDGVQRPRRAPKLVFAFSGQGGQYLGMSKKLYQTSQYFRDAMTQLDHLGQTLGFPSVLPYVLDNCIGGQPSPLLTQLATTIMQLSLLRLWTSWGVDPAAVIGHSLGEYAALRAAGVLTDAETIYLVGRRAQLLEEKCTADSHVMLAVKASPAALREALNGVPFELCCVNGPAEVVIGGPRRQVESAQQRLRSRQIASTIIQTPYAFHTAQMDQVLDEFDQVLRSINFRKPGVPIMSTVFGRVIPTNGSIDASYLRKHCRGTVEFHGAVVAAQKEGLLPAGSFMLEIGPHSVMTRQVKSLLGAGITAVPSLQRNEDDWAIVADAVKQMFSAGKDLHWREYHRGFGASHQVLQLPAYSWNLKDYWMQYVNDWSLRKGDSPLVAAPASATLLSSTIHTVVEDSIDKIIVESNLCHPELNALVQGHVVDGIPVCTPSVYADIALTVGKYMVERYHPELRGCQLDVARMTITKALIAVPKGEQPLRTTIEADWPAKEARMSFASFDQRGRPSLVHAQAVVRFTDQSTLARLEASVEETRNKMAGVRASMSSGAGQRFNRVMVYKMIRPLASFHQNYMTLDEVILNSNTLEAASKITLKDISMDGTYFTHPGIIDGLTQSGGFTMNCNDSNDLDREVFVNHGWESFQMFREIDPTRPYESYIKMTEGKGRMFHGDLVVIDEGQVAASYQGICLQGVARNVLRRILEHEAKQQSKVAGVEASQEKTPAAKSPTIALGKDVSKKAMTCGAPGVQTPDHLSSTQRVEFQRPPSNVSVPGPPVEVEQPAPQVMPSSESSTWTRALEIISDESGVPTQEMDAGMEWSDLGIDSILVLSITSRFREDLDVELDHSDLLTTYSTVAALKALFVGGEVTPPPVLDQQTLPVQMVTKPLPPQSEQKIYENADLAPRLAGELNTTGFSEALDIISDVTGLEPDELDEAARLADLGIDSLMALMISSRLKDEMDLCLEKDDIFQFETIGDLKSVFVQNTDSSSVSEASESVESMGSSDTSQSALDEPIPGRSKDVPIDLSKAVPPATSVVLQGSLATARAVLFLFPDGAGSATSYSTIPSVGSGVALVGLNSPYYRNPEEFKCTLDDLVDSYLNEIRRRQPQKPYHFGGWSAGGILAYHATQRAIAAGLEVKNLVLIDSPVPRGLDKLPDHFYEFLKRYEVFGHATKTGPGTVPAWLFPHFNATIDVLHDYVATPLPSGKAPSTSIIWAGQSVLEGLDEKPRPHEDDTEGMKFLTQRHPTFGGNGWESLFANKKLEIAVAEGANHFSMMRGRYALRLAKFIHDAL